MAATPVDTGRGSGEGKGLGLLPNHLSLSLHLLVSQEVSNERSKELEARDRDMTSLQSEVVRLTEQLGTSQQRLEERETAVTREQTRNEGLLESLRSEFSATRRGLEERCKELEEEVAGLREEGVRRERGDREREKEAERLQSLLQQTAEVYVHVLVSLHKVEE